MPRNNVGKVSGFPGDEIDSPFPHRTHRLESAMGEGPPQLVIKGTAVVHDTDGEHVVIVIVVVIVVVVVVIVIIVVVLIGDGRDDGHDGL